MTRIWKNKYMPCSPEYTSTKCEWDWILIIGSRQKLFNHFNVWELLKISINEILSLLAGVRKGREIRAREEGELGNASKDAIVFSVFHAEILSVKIIIGQIN